MQNESLRQEASVDAKTAEEALALAIRLQEERGEKIPIEQLNRTADEAGIDREYLVEALERVRQQKAEDQKKQALDDHEQQRMRVRIVAMVVGMLVAMGTAVMASSNHATPMPGYLWLLFAMVAALVVAKKLRNR